MTTGPKHDPDAAATGGCLFVLVFFGAMLYGGYVGLDSLGFVSHRVMTQIWAKAKQPYAFSMTDGAPFAFAGLWDAWKDPDGGWLQSFSIITTDANELMSRVHDRMPVILRPGRLWTVAGPRDNGATALGPSETVSRRRDDSQGSS
jgi:hypothetical protein